MPPDMHAASGVGNNRSTAQHDYRPHIDGLRAVAILSVVLYHAVPKRLPGGFVGVDIFFVISGYLISGIIFRQLDRSRFSFADFYIRRIRRIFPALTVVLLFTLTFGWFALLTDEYTSLGLHVAASAGSMQNMLLWTEIGYFNVLGDLKPLLHLWSLGIEEQFYLVWPLFVVLFGRKPRTLSAAIVVLTTIFFVVGLRYMTVDPDGAFYLPFARGWELMVGCWLANQQRPPDRSQQHAVASTTTSRYSADAWAVAGSMLLAVAVLGFHRTDPFPGWRALLPTIGTAMLIHAGAAAKINKLILSHPAAVFIGLISYPLYLWHWPLLSFARIIDDQPSTLVLSVLVLVAVLLAWLTYLCVERPLRSRTARLPTAAGLGAAMVGLGAVGLVVHGDHVKPRSAGFGLEQVTAGISESPYPPSTLPTTTWQNAEFPTVGVGQKVTLILGDSHAQHYFSRVDQLQRDGALTGRRVVFGAHAACPPIPEVAAPLLPNCERVRDAAFAYATEPEVDTVVFASNWPEYLRSGEQPYTIKDRDQDIHINSGTPGFDQALRNLENLVGSLVESGKLVYFVLQVPRHRLLDPRRAIDRDFPFFDFRLSPRVVRTADVRRRYAAQMDPLRDLAVRAGAIVIDPITELCDGNTCPVLARDGTPVFYNDGHFSALFGRYQVRYLDAAFAPGVAFPSRIASLSVPHAPLSNAMFPFAEHRPNRTTTRVAAVRQAGHVRKRPTTSDRSTSKWEARICRGGCVAQSYDHAPAMISTIRSLALPSP